MLAPASGYNILMIHGVRGKLIARGDNFLVVGTGSVDLKISVSGRTLGWAGSPGGEIRLFTHFHIREDAMELYGFPSEDELEFFELLISVSGVGPRSGLSIIDVAPLEELSAAIHEGRPDLLTKASGIGRKTAERIIVELRGKVASVRSGEVVLQMDTDADLVEALSNLGYRREEAREALARIPRDVTGVEARLKEALRLLGGRT
jgi:Holliday junction DNA helicase RuvA